MLKTPLHPLINPASAGHYSRPGEKTALEEAESMLTVDQLIGVCRFNAIKYAYRKDLKGQRESDIEKMATYQAYLAFLEGFKKSINWNEDSYLSVERLYEKYNIVWRYN